MSDSPTTVAWEKLAERHRLAERLPAGEIVSLSAVEIKEVTGREPRLMTKFDTRESRPKQLAHATILPVSNGEYIILPGDGYADMLATAPEVHWRLPKNVASLQTLPCVADRRRARLDDEALRS